MVREYVRLGMPGSAGAWCLEECQAWVDEKVRHRGERRPRAAKPPTDPMLDGPSSPALEQYRKHRAAMALLDLRERRGNLLPRDQVHALLVRLAGLLRSAGEVLQRQFGVDAATVLEEALNDADADIDRFFADARADRTQD